MWSWQKEWNLVLKVGLAKSKKFAPGKKKSTKVGLAKSIRFAPGKKVRRFVWRKSTNLAPGEKVRNLVWQKKVETLV